MIVYKDIIEKLAQRGYTVNRIRKEKLIPEGDIPQLHGGGTISVDTLDILCRLLECQPGDLLQYVSDFAPPGEWCVNCKKRGLVIRGEEMEEIPLCYAYWVELTDYDMATGQYRKCGKCLETSIL